MKSQKIVSLDQSKNYAIIGEVDPTTHPEIDAIDLKARKAQLTWSRLSIVERVTFLENLYKEFKARRNDLRSLIAQEMGMPLSVCNQIDIDPGLRYMQGYKVFV